MKAIAESTGRKMDAIKADLKEVGDLGLVAKVCFVLRLFQPFLSHSFLSEFQK